MRLIALAILILLAAAAHWAPAFVDPARLPAEFDTGLAVFVGLLGLWALVEAVLALKRSGAENDKVDELSALKAANQELETRLQTEVGQLRSDAERLATQKQRLEKELEQSKTLAQEYKEAFEDEEAKGKRMREEWATKEQPAEREIVGLLSLLQSKGRFIDFVMDDVARYGDAQIGAAARVVHQGCRSVVQEFFDIEPVIQGQEGSDLTLDSQYDAKRYKLLGKIDGEPPYKGRLLHRGWRTKGIRLPKVTTGSQTEMDQDIISPAEVEVRS